MVDLSRFSVKELSNEGVNFYLVDESGLFVEPGEEIPVKFVIYGVDSARVSKARREYNTVSETKNVKSHKLEEAALKFIVACVKSWDSFTFRGSDINDGDTEALSEFFEECPQFKDQIIAFVFERDHFLAKVDSK